MNGPANRRGFLRSLTTLPLIGGSVALIGAPTAVAEPVTEQMLDSYDAWLEYERRYLQYERTKAQPARRLRYGFIDERGKVWDYVPVDNAGAQFHFEQGAASGRAALVLSTVGCDWRKGSL